MLGLTICLGGAAACGPDEADDSDTLLARDGTDLVSHEGDTELLTAALVGSSGGQLALANTFPSGGLTPADLGEGAQAFFFPRGCVKPSHDSVTRTVSYTFNDCIGPFGLRKIKGTVRITYTKAANGPLSLRIVADPLAVGRATLRLDATSEVTAEGSTRRATWRAELDGTSARDRPIRRVVDHTLVFSTGESCIEASGRSTGSAGAGTVTVTLDRLKRCRGACPEAGGSVKVEGNRSNLTIAFDGTSEAKLTLAGKGRTITLACAK